jgi:hypothetical protein
MRTRETRDNQLKGSRPKRVSLREQHRDRLTVDSREPGFHYRIVNDIEDRIDKFKLAGYEIVQKAHKVGDEGVPGAGNESTGSDTRVSVGSGRKAILMRIPQEEYDADQAAKQRDIVQTEKALSRKKTNEGDDGTYGEVSVATRD